MILIFYLGNRKKWYHDSSFLLFGALLFMLRMGFPFEFSFTKTIYIKDPSFSPERFLFESRSIGNISFSAGRLLIFVWCIGIFINGMIFLRKILRFNYMKRCAIPCEKEKIMPVLTRIVEKYSFVKKVRFYRLPACIAPFSTGLLHAKIFLPDNGYEQEELYYVLLHEVAHFSGFDLWIKVIVELLCIIFWWNPLMRFLEKKVFLFLEFRADQKVFQDLEEDQRKSYIKCLTKSTVRKIPNEVCLQSEFCSENSSALYKRCTLLFSELEGQKKKQYTCLSFMKYIVLTVMIFFSYTVIFQTTSSEISPNDYAEGMLELLDIYSELSDSANDSIYLIKKDSDSYELYINDELQTLLTFESDKDIPLKVYSSLKEVYLHKNVIR